MLENLYVKLEPHDLIGKTADLELSSVVAEGNWPDINRILIFEDTSKGLKDMELSIGVVERNSPNTKRI